MKRIPASSAVAAKVNDMLTELQQQFVSGLENIAKSHHSPQCFSPIEWFRDDGKHGGGIRFTTQDGKIYGRGSVNVSQVHYDDNPDKKLGSATALSTIIHPTHPLAPSVHIHVSWTEMKSGDGYWRIMADLNPSIENRKNKTQFSIALKSVADKPFEKATSQGNRYFYIPALNRHRGIVHFYLEHYHSDDHEADYKLAKSVGKAAIDSYLNILSNTLGKASESTAEQRAMQLAYHTLYFFQVLTLDRGTTTGLLIHDQNDIGILGSLPACIDKDLLNSWLTHMPHPQNQLLQQLIQCLPVQSPCLIDDKVKQKLASVIRDHYAAYPEAIAMQASGDTTPVTVENHKNRDT